jgi:hypothetical protein
VCSVYDVNERENNEENKGIVLALFLEAFVTNCMETLLEAKEGKYLYTY